MDIKSRWDGTDGITDQDQRDTYPANESEGNTAAWIIVQWETG
jgi:hypothetical protein